jgi:pimeloyl-ACP methyl ester carboxylesterase
VAAAVAVVLVGLVVTRSGGGTHERAVHEDDPVLDPSKSDIPIERKIELTGGGGTKIGASFQLPPKGATPAAAVLIVPGFGAIDRDSVMAVTRDGSADRLSQDLNYSRPGTPDTLFRDLNDNFLSAGMATLRYDKRGGGASILPANQPLTYDDLVADARAGLDFLVQRKETSAAPVIVVGEDQGGLIAMRLAGDPHVKAVVLVSTFGRPLADVIGDDLVAARGDDGRAQSDQLHAVAAGLAAGQAVPPPAQLVGNLRALFPAAQEGYLRSVFGLDPVKEAAAVKVPALLVRGARDTTVTATDTDRLRAALGGSSEEMVVPDGDHNLGTAGRRDPAMLSQLTAWLKSRAGG